MTDQTQLEEFLAVARVDPAVTALRPDYRTLLVAATGITVAGRPTGADEVAAALLVRAEDVTRDLLADRSVDELPHVAAWREAYRLFGAKPQRTRNSLEALLRRAGKGLPRVNRLTDIYNALSVIHQVPLGGENLDAYVGAPRLVRASGAEKFDCIVDGTSVIDHPEPGEVVWCDDAGVTCRRWNWRQGQRTQLTSDTRSALFILDALAPMSDDALTAAGDDLVEHLLPLGTGVRIATRLVTTPGPDRPKEHP